MAFCCSAPDEHRLCCGLGWPAFTGDVSALALAIAPSKICKDTSCNLGAMLSFSLRSQRKSLCLAGPPAACHPPGNLGRSWESYGKGTSFFPSHLSFCWPRGVQAAAEVGVAARRSPDRRNGTRKSTEKRKARENKKKAARERERALKRQTKAPKP